MNANNPVARGQNEASAAGGSASTTPVENAQACFEMELALKAPPAKSRRERPEYAATSSIDILVKLLTREINGVKPFAGEWKEVFLQALARAPIVTVAAKIAGIPRSRAIKERMTDREFARQWNDAMEQGIDEVEAAAYHSAVFGDEKPVFYRGNSIGWTVEYSNAMRAMLLKAMRPRIFGKMEKSKEQTAPGITLDELRKRVEEARRDSPRPV